MNQNQDKVYPIIKCPHCQHGYAPAEIFHPHDFAGIPTSVLRDALGKVLYQEYKEDYEPGMATSYICDGCGKQFIVEPQITYKVKKESEELDFSNTSVSLLDL
jgi:DNA-directed RNA polymerase subunit RPC12/RpoP